MFRKLSAFILLLTFTGVAFGNTLLLVDYKINNDRYKKNCINKYRPYLHCNGKCQLMKKLKAQEEKEKNNSEKTTEINIILFTPVKEQIQVTATETVLQICAPADIQVHCHAGFSSAVFQPPRN